MSDVKMRWKSLNFKAPFQSTREDNWFTRSIDSAKSVTKLLPFTQIDRSDWALRSYLTLISNRSSTLNATFPYDSLNKKNLLMYYFWGCVIKKNLFSESILHYCVVRVIQHVLIFVIFLHSFWLLWKIKCPKNISN